MLSFLLIIEDEETRSKLEEIYLQYHNEMYTIAYAILKQAEDAEDVVQSSIIKLADYVSKISEIKCNKTRNLIVIIIRSTSIDLYRNRKRHPEIPIEFMENELEDQEQHHKIHQVGIHMDDIDFYAKTIAKVKEEYAQILTLKYYYEFEDKEIADFLSISHENVRVRLNRARNALRKILAEDNLWERRSKENGREIFG